MFNGNIAPTALLVYKTAKKPYTFLFTKFLKFGKSCKYNLAVKNGITTLKLIKN